MTFDASRMLAFDLETTSPNPREARIVTSALVSIDGSNVSNAELLADPGVEIPEAATAVHGITTEKARAEGRPHDEVLEETVQALYKAWDEGFTVIVYNAAYDLTILRQLTGAKDFVVTGTVFDPFVIDRVMDKWRKGRRTLGDVCEHYGVQLDNAHEATADALAAARVAWKQVRQYYPELAKMDDGELMEFQAVKWYEDRMAFKKYLEGRGRDASNVFPSWPLMS